VKPVEIQGGNRLGDRIRHVAHKTLHLSQSLSLIRFSVNGR
jgi:hypothetical protein